MYLWLHILYINFTFQTDFFLCIHTHIDILNAITDRNIMIRRLKDQTATRWEMNLRVTHNLLLCGLKSLWRQTVTKLMLSRFTGHWEHTLLKAIFFFFKGKCRKKGKSYDKETTAITRTYDITFKFRSQSDYKNIYIQNILSNYFSFREGRSKQLSSLPATIQ